MITKSGELIYIENFRAVKGYLDNSGLSKYRSKLSDDKYTINGLICKKLGTIWMIGFVNPKTEGKKNTKSWVLSDEKTLLEVKGMFNEIFDKNIPLPYFLKFSNTIDDNIFINLEVKNFLEKVFMEAGNFREES